MKLEVWPEMRYKTLTIMILDRLKKMRNRAPFRAFQIHLTTGEVLAVGHPEQMSLPENETEMFVVWTKRDWNLIEAKQVARVRVLRRAAKFRQRN